MKFEFIRTNIKAGVYYYSNSKSYQITKNNGDVYYITPTLIRISLKIPENFTIAQIANLKYSCIVDFTIDYMKINLETGEIRQIQARGNKKSEINHAVKECMNNIEGAIKEFVECKNFNTNIEDFIIDFDASKEYVVLSSLKATILKKLEDSQFDDIDKMIKSFATRKELEEFYKEMEHAITIKANEKVFESILKKHEKLLPLIIPSIDLMKGFQYLIEEEGMEQNIIDATAVDNDNIPNLIELKKSDTELLSKGHCYRNNTYKPTSEFAGAIQQTNIQRIHYALTASRPEQIIVKSILIIGNKKEEFGGHPQEIVFLYNFNTIRYNNKDVEIITYDELLERIKKISSKI